MAEPKTQKTNASVSAFIAAVEDETPREGTTGLVPPRARDTWMAMAIGVGVAVAASLLLPRSAYPLFLLSVPIALVAVSSAASAWLSRKLGIG